MRTKMPNLFIEAHQEFAIFPPAKAADKFNAVCGPNANLEIKLQFTIEDRGGTIGFVITAENFLSGGIAVARDNEGFRIKIEGVAKAKVYDMQMTSFAENEPLVYSGISLPGSLEAYTPQSILKDGADKITINEEEYVKFSGKIGTKKSSMETYTNP
jgi:hypothetical protein